MLRTIMPLGEIQANCYVLIDENSGEAAVIDPGACTSALLAELSKARELKYILLTHGHYDHILGASELKMRFPQAKIAIHANDEICLADTKYSLADDSEYCIQTPVAADVILKEGDEIAFGDVSLKVMHTPGHSRGSVCFVDEERREIYSGDTVFCHTVGRTDFLGGSTADMLKSLARLKALNGDYEIFPGHNHSTTLAVEREKNRYMRKL